jgi:hypothetical protein
MRYSPSALEALRILRDPSHFQWYVVPLLGFVVYLYCVEIGKRHWDVVAAGLAGIGIDWAGEIGNALWMRISGYAPLWSEPGPTAYLILIGINIETALMFAVFGLAIAKVLPRERSFRNRAVVVLAFALFCVAVETVLNAWGALRWDWWWWGPSFWSVVVFGHGPAAAFVVWIHDLRSRRAKVAILGGLYLVNAAAMVIFTRVLGWI